MYKRIKEIAQIALCILSCWMMGVGYAQSNSDSLELASEYNIKISAPRNSMDTVLIEYYVPQIELISLIWFNTNGKVLDTIVDRKLSSVGMHSVEIVVDTIELKRGFFLFMKADDRIIKVEKFYSQGSFFMTKNLPKANHKSKIFPSPFENEVIVYDLDPRAKVLFILDSEDKIRRTIKIHNRSSINILVPELPAGEYQFQFVDLENKVLETRTVRKSKR